MCGLNPHAGEGGYLGREEIDIIAPAVAAMRAAGHDVTGPLPADTVFVPDIAKRFDVIVAMYHDQGLPVLKAASFGHGVNVTLGFRSSAHRSITGRRSTSRRMRPARGMSTREAFSPRSNWRSSAERSAGRSR